MLEVGNSGGRASNVIGWLLGHAVGVSYLVSLLLNKVFYTLYPIMSFLNPSFYLYYSRV